MGKHLLRRHARLGAQALHLRPNLRAAQRAAAFGEEDRAKGDFVFPGEFQEPPTETGGKENRAEFSLQRNVRAAPSGRFHRDIADLAHPNPGSADRFHQQRQPFPALCAGGTDKAAVLRAAQLPLRRAKAAVLEPQRAHPAVLPARQSEKFTQPSQHGVDSGGGMCFRKASPPLRGAAAGHRGLPVPAGEGPNAADVIFHRTGAALPLCQLPPECIDLPRRNRCGRSALSHTVSSQSF